MRTHGVEVELTGAMTPRWNVMAGLTWQNAEYVEGPSEGDRYDPAYTPKQLAKLATTYDLPGMSEGLTVGARIRAQSGAYAEGIGYPNDVAYRIEQPGYAVFRAMARYAFDERTALQLTVDTYSTSIITRQ